MEDKKRKLPQTLRALKASGYKPCSVKDEVRRNLLQSINENQKVFEGIHGYDDTVIPDLERSILSRHNILLLGLRGQAKTRLARMMVNLLDEFVPFVQGSELFEDPLSPITERIKSMIREMGDDLPIDWLHRSERYTEKLATPDVSIADLIGDIDPMKAVKQGLSYSDERVIHYGLIPRSNRGIFVINELPDLQPRIQVSLFNILQEEDIQIRGFKLRLPLDIWFVFTANPEDYTNRGNIVTPLKDRIDSQILTHYPKDVKDSLKITEQESRLSEEQISDIEIPSLIKELIEQVAIEARNNEFVDAKSGVSARMTISALENLVSGCERRKMYAKDLNTHARVSDLQYCIPAITGKIELVYEGEQEGAIQVANALIRKSIRTVFLRHFKDPNKYKGKNASKSPYKSVIDWFGNGNQLDLISTHSEKDWKQILKEIPGLEDLTEMRVTDTRISEQVGKEFVLHGLAECSMIGKVLLHKGYIFNDLMGSMLSGNLSEDFDE